MSRVLVTGAHGFIGRFLVPALVRAGHEVVAAGRGKPPPAVAALWTAAVQTVVHGDLRGDVDWRELLAGVDFVVHLAAIAHTGPGVPDAEYDRVNHRASAALAAGAAAAGVRRLVLVSSIRAQSGAAADRVLTEAQTAQPQDAYGRSKLAAEAAVARSGVDFTVLRPVVVYGPGIKGNLRTLARLAALPLPLPFGAFTNRRSLLAIDNLAAAVSHVLTHRKSRRQTYVVADPHPVTPAQIVRALRAGLGRPDGLLDVPPGLIRLALTLAGRRRQWEQIGGPMVVDPGKLIAAGWQPRTDTAAAMAQMMREKP